MMVSAKLQTDWSLLSKLLRLAQRDGWDISFAEDRVSVAHRRARGGLVVLPVALLGHAREEGWRVARQPAGFELRHPSVRQRVEVSLASA